MRWNFFKSPICLIAAPVILLVCVLELTKAQSFQRLEWLTYDWRVKLAHRFADSVNCATNLGFVEMSDNTIALVNSGALGYKFGLYWPRQVYGRALSELTREGAKAVAFDVLFAETRPDQPPYYFSKRVSMASDDYFADQLSTAGNVILAAAHEVLPAPQFMTNAWRVGNITTDMDGDGVLRRDQAFANYYNWHPYIRDFATAYNVSLSRTELSRTNIRFFRISDTNNPIDIPLLTNGMVATSRFKNPLPEGDTGEFKPYEIVRVWSMGIALAAFELKLDLDHPEIDAAHHRIILHGEHGLTRVISVDDRNYFYIDWSLAVNDPRLTEGSFESLLESERNINTNDTVTNRWKGKLTVIGSTATGNDLADTGATPLEAKTFLASKHWNVANSIITGRFITVTPTPVNLALIVAFGILAGAVTWTPARPLMGSVLMAVSSVVYLGLAVVLFVQWRIWLPICLPLVCAGLVTHFGALTYRVTIEQSEKKRIKGLFSRLVSPEIVNKVLETQGVSLDELTGRRREITVYFADIRGFTELTDAAQAENTEFVRRYELSPQLAEDYFDEQAKEVMNTVSLYLGTIADCVKKHQGTFDKYIGDCAMAFWGAPLDNPHHAVAAVRCAIEAQRRIFALNEQREAENKRRETENLERLRTGKPTLPRIPVLSMGSGVNTGMAIAGFMGSEEHQVNYTVFGREVNLASRLEGVSGHGRIIIGEGTHAALVRDDLELARLCIELPPKTVKGFRERVRIFEVRWQPTGFSTETVTRDTTFTRA